MITLFGDLNRERKIGRSGCARIWAADLPLEVLDLRVERPDHGHEAEHQLAGGSELQLADPGCGARGAAWTSARSGAARLSIARAPETLASAQLPDRERLPDWGSCSRNASRISASMCENSRNGPGQNRSSSARSWLTIAVRAATRSSRARVSARIAFV